MRLAQPATVSWVTRDAAPRAVEVDVVGEQGSRRLAVAVADRLEPPPAYVACFSYLGSSLVSRCRQRDVRTNRLSDLDVSLRTLVLLRR
jgi:hypothetical protein